MIFLCTGLAALGATGVVLASNGGGLTTTPVSASFSASPDSNINTRVCTGTDGTYKIMNGQWTGTASSSNARLAGPLTIRGKLAVNQNTGAGWLVGHLRIAGDERRDAGGDLRGVIAGGKLSGFLSGLVRDQGVIYGSVSATVAVSGFSDGQIGGGTVVPAAVVIDHDGCPTIPPPAQPRPRADMHGTVSAVSQSSLTVKQANGNSLTCVVGSDQAATVARLKVGDTAFVKCGLVDGNYRLLKVQSPALNPKPKPVVRATGRVSAVSATSLAIVSDRGQPVTCTVGADFATRVAKVSTGQRVSVTCGIVDGSYRLLALRGV